MWNYPAFLLLIPVLLGCILQSLCLCHFRDQMYQSKVILNIPGFPFVSVALVVMTPLSCLMFVILPFFSLIRVARGCQFY